MKAIVYTSNTGHTADYAGILGKETGLPVYSLKDAEKQLEKNTPVIYLGWLFANSIKGYQKARKLFSISAVCAVGLCDTGTALEPVREANRLPEEISLFTLQGGMDKTRLSGIYRFMIRMLTKAVSSRRERSEDDERMLDLLTHDQNYVSKENAFAFMEWYRKQI